MCLLGTHQSLDITFLLAMANVFRSSGSVLGVMDDISKMALNQIPQNYIRPEQEPLTQTHHYSTIPVLDLKCFLDSANDRHIQLQNLFSTCKDWGFFQVVNHGVSAELLGQLKIEIQKFFHLPSEEKEKYQIRPGDVQGYGTVIRCKDQKLDWGDRFYAVINPLHRRKPYLVPQLPPSLRDTLEPYFTEVRRLAMQLLRLLAEAIKIEMKEVEELFEEGMQSVRMTYYPPCPEPELVVGLTPHSDATGITILHQVNGVEGLEIKKDGVWIPVTFLSDAFVVNVGDIMEILSNGAYSSIEHRAAVNREKERISIAMFFNPKFEAEIGPCKSIITPQNPPLFKRILMEDYFKDFFSHNLNGKSHLDRMKINTAD